MIVEIMVKIGLISLPFLIGFVRDKTKGNLRKFLSFLWVLSFVLMVVGLILWK